MKPAIKRSIYKINETVQYIEEHLDKDLSLEKLAKIAQNEHSNF